MLTPDTPPKHDWRCNKCGKRIEVAFLIRLCDMCFLELEQETEEIKAIHGTRVLSDEEFAQIFCAPKDKQN